MIDKIKNFAAMHLATATSRLLAAYLAFACLWGAFHLGYTAINGIGYITGITSQQELTVADFVHVGIEMVDENTVINATDDSQMIYTGNIRNLLIKCDFSLPPGEFVCFYNYRGNDAFGTHRMKYAKIYDGYYLFEFPIGTKQIRLDTGVEPSIKIDFHSITINTPSLKTVTGVTVGDCFTLLTVPALIFMAGETACSLAKQIKKKK